MRMSFGQYKGKDIFSLPPEYLNWLKVEVNPKTPEFTAEIEWVLWFHRIFKRAPESREEMRVAILAKAPERKTEKKKTSEPKLNRLQKRMQAIGHVVKAWIRREKMAAHRDRGGSDEAFKAVSEASDRLIKDLKAVGVTMDN